MKNFFKKILLSLLLPTAAIPLNVMCINRQIVLQQPETGHLVFLYECVPGAGTAKKRQEQINKLTEEIKKSAEKDKNAQYNVLFDTPNQESRGQTTKLANLTKEFLENTLEQKEALAEKYLNIIKDILPEKERAQVLGSQKELSDIKNYFIRHITGYLDENKIKSLTPLKEHESFVRNLSSIQNTNISTPYSGIIKAINMIEAPFELGNIYMFKAMNIPNIDHYIETFNKIVDADNYWETTGNLVQQHFINDIKLICEKTKNKTITSLAEELLGEITKYFQTQNKEVLSVIPNEMPLNQIAIKIIATSTEHEEKMRQRRTKEREFSNFKSGCNPIIQKIIPIWVKHLLQNMKKLDTTKDLENKKVSKMLQEQMHLLDKLRTKIACNTKILLMLNKIHKISQHDTTHPTAVFIEFPDAERLQSYLHDCDYITINNPKIYDKDGKSYERSVDFINVLYTMVTQEPGPPYTVEQYTLDNIAPIKLSELSLLNDDEFIKKFAKKEVPTTDLTDFDTEELLEEVANRMGLTPKQFLELQNMLTKPAQDQPSEPKEDQKE